jgi:hypothetical protein
MIWQDAVIAAAQFVGFFALIPSIRSSDKPAFITSALNASILAIIAFCMATLSLWISFITAASISIAWGVLAAQKYKINQKQG